MASNRTGALIRGSGPFIKSKEVPMNEKRRYWFEDVPEEQRFYFLVQYAEGELESKGEGQGEMRQRSVFEPTPEIEEIHRRQHEIGFVPETLSAPIWADVQDRP